MLKLQNFIRKTIFYKMKIIIWQLDKNLIFIIKWKKHYIMFIKFKEKKNIKINVIWNLDIFFFDYHIFFSLHNRYIYKLPCVKYYIALKNDYLTINSIA